MSRLNPDKSGARKSVTNTAAAELRITRAGSGLDWKSNLFQVIGQGMPDGFTPNPSMDKVQVRGGVVSTLQGQHMSSRDSAFSFNMEEDTLRAKQLANGTDLPPVFEFAASGFTLGTLDTGSTPLMLSMTAAPTGLERDHMLYMEHFAGELHGFVEEVYVDRVDGNHVHLRNALSVAPAAGIGVKRVANYNVPDGGTNYEELHVNIKNTLIDGSLNILNYPDTRIDTGKKNPGSNSKVRGVELSFTALSKPEEINGVDEPVFSREYLVPRKEVAALVAA